MFSNWSEIIKCYIENQELEKRWTVKSEIEIEYFPSVMELSFYDTLENTSSV